jgi:hypothetical protein
MYLLRSKQPIVSALRSHARYASAITMSPTGKLQVLQLVIHRHCETFISDSFCRFQMSPSFRSSRVMAPGLIFGVHPSTSSTALWPRLMVCCRFTIVRIYTLHRNITLKYFFNRHHCHHYYYGYFSCLLSPITCTGSIVNVSV